MAYDSADFSLREINPNHITGAAGASMQKFLMYRSTILKRVVAMVVTAGTNTAAGVDIYNGTTSVGTMTFGTNTAGSIIDSGALNVDVAAQSYIELKGVATHGATLVGAFQIQHQPDPSN